MFMSEAIERETTVVDDPASADLIVLVPAMRPMFHWYGRHLLADPVVSENLDRCFVLERSDGPNDYLRGCYAALASQRFDPLRHRAIGYARPKEWWWTEGAKYRPEKPRLLFSFRGAESHPVRRRMVRELGTRTSGRVSLTTTWKSYSNAERESFWTELGETAFVLCPRGLGTATFRTQEAMQAGRVPVVISDDWVAPKGPAWADFSLCIPEREISRIPEFLEDRLGDAKAMGEVARAEWERYFDTESGAFVRWMLTSFEEVAQADPDWDASTEIDRWRSIGFRWSHGFDPVHRATRRVHRLVLQSLPIRA